MHLFDAFAAGLEQLASYSALIGLFAGTALGFLFGIIPGLQSVTALVVVLPFTFGLDPIVAMYIFAGIIGSAGRGGSVTAIALGIPGTAQNAATVLDGYPMTKRGETSRALGIAASTAVLGATFGLLTLLLFIPVFVPFLMNFGPGERFWVMTIGLVAMSVALPTNFLAGLAAVAIGIILAGIGFGGPTIAVPRFTFGSSYLVDGLDLVVVILGLLVISEAIGYLFLSQQQTGIATMSGSTRTRVEWRRFIQGMLEPLRYPLTVIRSSAIGTIIGAVPGVGGVVAQFFSYNMAYAASKEQHLYGKGSVEGLIAAEAAVDAKEGGILLPTVVFGIPGNGEMALVLAAWMIHGLQPGPYFLESHANLVWALILGLFLANIIATAMTLGCTSLAARVPRLRSDHVGIGVILFSILAVMAVRQNLWDVGLVLTIGLFGFVMRQAGVPVIGMVIGFVLGKAMESDFYTALQSGRGSYAILVESPVSLTLAGGTALIVLWTGVKYLKTRRTSEQAATGTTRKLRGWLLSPQPVVLAMALLILAAMFAAALQPGFRGGGFLTSVLGIAVGLVAILVMRAATDVEGLARDEPEDELPLKLDERQESAWMPVLMAAIFSVGFFVAVTFFGVMIGSTIAVFAVLWRHMHVPLRNAAPLAAVWGFLVPVIFSKTLEVSMWPGLVPELIPQWLGGGILPPW
jgi:putative tricarboxylic transport membrane protein